MTEPHDRNDSFADVEALVRAAGDYVKPSPDLRPRVLELARLENSERRARRRIRRAALLFALWAFFTITGIERLEAPDSLRQLTLLAVASHAGAEAKAGGDSAWALVDAYSELRRRQAAVLRL